MVSKSPRAPDVEEFLSTLSHPNLPAIRVLRECILGADPSIRDEIKWNAPSFRTSESFATFHLRSKSGVQLILHGGAKKRVNAPWRSEIHDPASLLTWLGDDRASVAFETVDDIQEKRSAFVELVRQWIRHL